MKFTGQMIVSVLWVAIKAVYRSGLRRVFKQAIDDPTSTADETVMEFVDGIMGVKKKEPDPSAKI